MLPTFKSLLMLALTAISVEGGLLTGDLKLKSRPLTINSHHAPVHININTDKLKPTLPALSLSKPAKPPPKILKDLLKPSLFPKSPLSSLSLRSSKLRKLSSLLPSNSIFSPLSTPKLSRSSIFSKSVIPSLGLSKLSSPLSKFPTIPSLSKPILTKLSAPILPPIVPKLPFLPPFLPPIIPLPLLPLVPPIVPGLPLISPVLNPLKPLRVPILGTKSPLQALGSELSPVVIDITDERKHVILEKKLRNLVKRGSLTNAEFKRFRKLLLG